MLFSMDKTELSEIFRSTDPDAHLFIDREVGVMAIASPIPRIRSEIIVATDHPYTSTDPKKECTDDLSFEKREVLNMVGVYFAAQLNLAFKGNAQTIIQPGTLRYKDHACLLIGLVNQPYSDRAKSEIKSSLLRSRESNMRSIGQLLLEKSKPDSHESLHLALKRLVQYHRLDMNNSTSIPSEAELCHHSFLPR